MKKTFLVVLVLVLTVVCCVPAYAASGSGGSDVTVYILNAQTFWSEYHWIEMGGVDMACRCQKLVLTWYGDDQIIDQRTFIVGNNIPRSIPLKTNRVYKKYKMEVMRHYEYPGSAEGWKNHNKTLHLPQTDGQIIISSFADTSRPIRSMQIEGRY